MFVWISVLGPNKTLNPCGSRGNFRRALCSRMCDMLLLQRDALRQYWHCTPLSVSASRSPAPASLALAPRVGGESVRVAPAPHLNILRPSVSFSLAAVTPIPFSGQRKYVKHLQCMWSQIVKLLKLANKIQAQIFLIRTSRPPSLKSQALKN